MSSIAVKRLVQGSLREPSKGTLFCGKPGATKRNNLKIVTRSRFGPIGRTRFIVLQWLELEGSRRSTVDDLEPRELLGERRLDCTQSLWGDVLCPDTRLE